MKWPRAAGKRRKSIADALATVTPALLSNDRGAPSEKQIRRTLYTWSFNTTRHNARPPPDDLVPVVKWLASNTVTLTAMKDAAVVRKALDLLATTTLGNPLPRRPLPASEPSFAAHFGTRPNCRLESHPILRAEDCEFPEKGWGGLRLAGSTQHVGEGWGDTDGVREDRELKHRAKSATRYVPVPPVLTRILRNHIEEFGHAPNGRLFVAQSFRGGAVSLEACTRVWRNARRVALTPAQQRTPLGRRPYDLRHAAVSLWLNAEIPAPQVAERAGHSLHVLLKVYAKCIDGQDEAARRRIESALTAEKLEPTAREEQKPIKE